MRLRAVAAEAAASDRTAQTDRVHPLAKIGAVLAIALVTANCAQQNVVASKRGGGGGVDPRYGVAASPRVIPEGQSIPKGGGRAMVGKPYVVAGRTYVPRENASYSREGLASWYGSDFHGRLTANGEIFDRETIAAAHATMPLPSYARVTNRRNGRSLIVRVNDRGPYHAGRLIDVSERAAEALDFKRAGTTEVRVDYVGRASIHGSDDARLMATLRDDGGPAGLGRARAPVMVAELAAQTPRPAPAREREPEGKKPVPLPAAITLIAARPGPVARTLIATAAVPAKPPAATARPAPPVVVRAPAPPAQSVNGNPVRSAAAHAVPAGSVRAAQSGMDRRAMAGLISAEVGAAPLNRRGERFADLRPQRGVPLREAR